MTPEAMARLRVFTHDEFGMFMRFTNANDPATKPQGFRARASERTEPHRALI